MEKVSTDTLTVKVGNGKSEANDFIRASLAALKVGEAIAMVDLAKEVEARFETSGKDPKEIRQRLYIRINGLYRKLEAKENLRKFEDSNGYTHIGK